MEEENKPQVKFVENSSKQEGKRNNKSLIALISAIVVIVVLIVIFLIPHRSMEKVDAYFEKDDTASALSMLRAMGENGDTSALNRLGRMYEEGDTVSQDLKLSTDYYLESAKLKNPYAAYVVGKYFYKQWQEQTGDEESLKNALNWFTQSAQQSYTSSYYYLGLIYGIDGNTITDYKKSFENYKKGASLDVVKCYYGLANCYKNGKGTVKNLNEAFKNYNKGAQEGDFNCAFNLSTMYSNGEGTSVNKALGEEWFSKAADFGHPIAQLELGDKALEKKDYADAEMWYSRLAENKNASQMTDDEGDMVNAKAFAEYRLGLAYYSQNDLDNAEHYFELSSLDGYGKADRPLETVRELKEFRQ